MLATRAILHLDLDAFFCAVEELREPSLRGKPFAVGGRPEQRGVVASCSYAARAAGVRSAMPMSRALRLCPALLIIPARHGAYGEVSKQVMARLHALTPLVEQVSIDEAYLDVTALGGDPATIARTLQAAINAELGLPCSLGVATNKLVAKIANNVGKASARGSGHASGSPNAITVVAPGQEAAFLAPLPCAELWGVGPRTAARLEALGIRTIGDLARQPEATLIQHFGKHGAELWLHARGRDDSPLVTQRERKSISQETTFARDVRDGELLRRTLFEQARAVAVTLRRKQLVGSTVKIKLRWSDFTTITRQVTLPERGCDPQAIFQAAARLLEKAWDGRPVRLIGVGVSSLTSGLAQPTLFETPDPRQERLQETLDALRARFGADAVRRAAEIDESRSTSQG